MSTEDQFTILGETYKWTSTQTDVYDLSRKNTDNTFFSVGSIYDSSEGWIVECQGWAVEAHRDVEAAKLDLQGIMEYCRYGEEFDTNCADYRVEASEFCTYHTRIVNYGVGMDYDNESHHRFKKEEDWYFDY